MIGSHSASTMLRRKPGCSLLFWLIAVLYSSSLSPNPAFAQDSQSQKVVSGVLRGTVINSVTREPVSRALVYSPDNRFATFTDDQGQFEFRVPRTEVTPAAGADRTILYNSPIQLMARKPGFLAEDTSMAYLPQSAAIDDITIALVPESLIVGRVSLPSSNQADRISVQVYKRDVREGRAHWVLAATVRTRSNGEFRIADLSAGTYKVFTQEMLDRDPLTFDPGGQLYGYPPVYYPTASDFAGAAPITLESGKILQVELSPVLQPYYPVKIGITNMQAEGTVLVSVALQGHKGPGYSLGYSGEQTIEGMLPNGTYRIEAMLQGEQSASGTINITVKGAPVTNATMTLIPNGSIPVNIKDESSARTRGTSGTVFRMGEFSREQKADVYLQPADDFNSMGAVALRPPRKPHDSPLVLENVPPGRYWITVNPFVGYVASAVAGNIDLLRNPLVVAPGAASPAIDIVLRDESATIELKVEGTPAQHLSGRNPAGVGSVTAYVGLAPPQGPYVYCVPLPDSSGLFRESWVSTEGTLQIQQLPPGAYRILAFERQQRELEYHNPEAMRAYEGKGPVVHLSAGQTEHVRVPLISLASER